jgi:hypothetical protein
VSPTEERSVSAGTWSRSMSATARNSSALGTGSPEYSAHPVHYVDHHAATGLRT